jgi:hypothetical protein
MKNKVWMASGLALSFITSILTATAADSFRSDIFGSNKGGLFATPWGQWQSRIIFCPAGSYVGGYSMRVEPPQGKGDDTALNGLTLNCYDRAGKTAQLVALQGNWGNWGQSANCPTGTYATAFKLKIEGPQGTGDDTGVNSLKFTCSKGHEIEASGGGQWGSWTSWLTAPIHEIPTSLRSRNPKNLAICGVRGKIESYQGKGDDTSVNDLEFIWCRL